MWCLAAALPLPKTINLSLDNADERFAHLPKMPPLPFSASRLVLTYATIPTSMLLSHLSLTNFRNFIRLEADFQGGSTILVGANAQGKTSLLEAIYYLAGATSPHATSDRQLINFLTLKETLPFARIAAEFHLKDRLQRIEIRIILEPIGPLGEIRLKKEVLINGLKKRVGDLSGIFNVVMFLPQDMRIIEGPPEGRRRSLDFTLTQADPAYAAARQEYAKVLTQRNALLKQLQERNAVQDELAFWDEQIADHGATIMRSRAVALNELEEITSKIHTQLTRSSERLRLIYKPSYLPDTSPEYQLDLPLETTLDLSTTSWEKLRTGLRSALQDTRRIEIQRGMTLLGPHRDDIRIHANGIDLHLYGSRGQNRTAMLAAKLGEVEWLLKKTGDWPVLLLDEVLAELDRDRREDLLSRLETAHQAILTAADLSMFTESFQEKAIVWQISGGRILSSTE
jgi:DNA replication and repair protein RecF